MAYVLDDDYSQLPPPPTRAEVEADIADWKARLSDIMTCIQGWLVGEEGICCDPIEYRMSEPKMAFVDIHEGMVLPGLKITSSFATKDMGRHEHSRHAIGKILPDARWVIGTRGQIRFWTPEKVYTIADLGQPEHPEWYVTSADDLILPPFTKPVLLKMLGSLR